MRALLFASILAMAAIVPAAHAGIFLPPGGQSQTVRVMTAVPVPIIFTVTDSSGHPVGGATVDVQVVSGPRGADGIQGLFGVSDPQYIYRYFTDQDGVTTNPYAIYPVIPGTFALHATSDYGSLDFTITGVDGARPSRIEVISGAGQSAPGGGGFAPFSVRVLDSDNKPMPRTPVRFQQFYHSGLATASGNFDTLMGGEPTDVPIATADENGIATTVSPFNAGIFTGQGVMTAYTFTGYPTPKPITTDIPFTVTAPVAGTPSSYQDMWWVGEEENGWGLAILEHDRRIFAIIYAYDAAGNPTWYMVPDAHWIYAEGYHLTGTLYRPSASPFTSFDTNTLVVGPKQGGFGMTFTSPNDALLTVAGSVSGVPNFQKYVTRQTFGDPKALAHGVGDMWWGDFAQSGWGVSVIEHFDTLFSVWFTYGADSKATWFVMPGGTWNASDYTGLIYTTSNPTWASGKYSADSFTITQAGSYTMHLSDPQGATRFNYNVHNLSGSLPFVREPF